MKKQDHNSGYFDNLDNLNKLESFRSLSRRIKGR